MTVGIGAICHGGNLIVMAADTRGSYEDPTIGPNDCTGKQYDLPLNFSVNIAGAVNLCNSVVAFLHDRIKSFETLPNVFHDHFRNAIRDAQLEELTFQMDYALVNELGMTRLEWNKAWPTNPRVRQAGRAVFRRIPFQLELTVAGFVRGYHVLLTAEGKQAAETETNFSVIGCGAQEAQEHLDKRGQYPWVGLSRTLVHICEAIRMAGIAYPESIGEAADYVIISPKGYYRIPVDFVNSLASQYSGHDTEPLDRDEESFKRIRNACYTHMTQEEMRAGKRPQNLAAVMPSTAQRSVRARSPYDAEYPEKEHLSFDD